MKKIFLFIILSSCSVINVNNSKQIFKNNSFKKELNFFIDYSDYLNKTKENYIIEVFHPDKDEYVFLASSYDDGLTEYVKYRNKYILFSHDIRDSVLKQWVRAKLRPARKINFNEIVRGVEGSMFMNSFYYTYNNRQFLINKNISDEKKYILFRKKYETRQFVADSVIKSKYFKKEFTIYVDYLKLSNNGNSKHFISLKKYDTNKYILVNFGNHYIKMRDNRFYKYKNFYITIDENIPDEMLLKWFTESPKNIEDIDCKECVKIDNCSYIDYFDLFFNSFEIKNGHFTIGKRYRDFLKYQEIREYYDKIYKK